MTYCVSSYEHASRQNVDKNKSHWATVASGSEAESSGDKRQKKEKESPSEQ